MKIIDDNLINGVVEQAKQSPRLRMNYNFHESLDDKCHRFLNCLEPGTFILRRGHPQGRLARAGMSRTECTPGVQGRPIRGATMRLSEPTAPC